MTLPANPPTMPTNRRSTLAVLGLAGIGVAAARPHQVRHALDLPTATIRREIDHPAQSIRVIGVTVPDGLVTLTLDVTAGQPVAWIAAPPDDAKPGVGLENTLGIDATPDTPTTTAPISEGDYALVVQAAGDRPAKATVSLSHY